MRKHGGLPDSLRFWFLADNALLALEEYTKQGRLLPNWRAPIEEARRLLVDALEGRRIVDTMCLKGYRSGVLEACEWAGETIKVLRGEEHVVEVLEAEIHRHLALLDLLLVPEKPVLSCEDTEALTAFFRALQQAAMTRQERERQEREEARHDPFGYHYCACAVA